MAQILWNHTRLRDVQNGSPQDTRQECQGRPLSEPGSNPVELLLRRQSGWIDLPSARATAPLASLLRGGGRAASHVRAIEEQMA
jgi:hypothetical protein